MEIYTIQSVINTQNTIEVIGEIKSFVNQELLDGDDSGIEASTPLLEMGILTSLAMVSLLGFVQDKFNVSVPDESVTPENFGSLQTISELVAKLNAGKAELPQDERVKSDLLETVRILEASGIKRHQVKLDLGDEIHFLKADGSQPTWVLLPGLGNPSSSWGNMMQSLQDENETIAVDFTGFGLSFSPKERPMYFDHLQATLQLLDRKLVEPPFVVVGSSAGAMIAAEIARQRPEWIHALVVTGFGLIEDAPAWWQRLQYLSQVPESFLEAAYHRPPKLTTSLQQILDDVLASPAYYSFLEGGGLEVMRTSFDDLSVPTLFVSGESDNIIPKSAVEAAVRRVPGARLEWLARCGHFPPSEQPEELLYIVRNFLKSLN